MRGEGYREQLWAAAELLTHGRPRTITVAGCFTASFSPGTLRTELHALAYAHPGLRQQAGNSGDTWEVRLDAERDQHAGVYSGRLGAAYRLLKRWW